ncbi:tetratricopeptide repeat protein [Streptomyces sp. NPDC054840]
MLFAVRAPTGSGENVFSLIVTVRSRVWGVASWMAWARGGAAAPWHEAAIDDAHRLLVEGMFEEAEERARGVVAVREGVWGRDRRPGTVWRGRYCAVLAAVLHGRGASVLAETEGLIAELEHLTGANRLLLLQVRLCRAWVLIEEGRAAEAEAEATYVLQALTRIMHLTSVWDLELWALLCIGDALRALDRHEEAETIARGHLPRAEEMAADLQCLLVRSLSGQGRHAEALAESGRQYPEWLPAARGELELATAVALHGLGRHDEAKEEALRALTACERSLHPSHPRVGEVRALLARIASV